MNIFFMFVKKTEHNQAWVGSNLQTRPMKGLNKNNFYIRKEMNPYELKKDKCFVYQDFKFGIIKMMYHILSTQELKTFFHVHILS